MANETVTFRDVQGKTRQGTYLNTHPMTGEVEVNTPQGRAYVTRDRILSGPTTAVEAHPNGWADIETATTGLKAHTPQTETSGTLEERTRALLDIVSALTTDTSIATVANRANARISIHAPNGYNSLSATLNPDTTDIHIRDSRTSTGTWLDVLTALNVIHAWISEHASQQASYTGYDA